jgi:hypothetical protein
LSREWRIGPGLGWSGFGIARKSRLDVEADLREGALVELLQDFSSGDTGLQIVYPATQAQPRRVRLLIEKIAQAFSSSGPKFWSWPGISRDVGSATPQRQWTNVAATQV